jgi:LTXXQ motif family protein
MRISPTVMTGFSLLLLGLPAAAQQAAPAPPAAPSAPTTQGPSAAGMMGGPGMMGGRGPGGMGMMMGSRVMGSDDEDDEDDGGQGRMRRWHYRPEARRTPMQVIINIGPDNRVETEEHGPAGVSARPGWRMMGGEWRGRWMAERVGAHLDDLHDQLQLTADQQPAWDRFASAVRDAVTRMRSGPAGMMQGQGFEQRLAAYETMLNSRLEAVRAIRGALSGLTGSLNDAQKHTLDEEFGDFMPGRFRMQSRW